MSLLEIRDLSVSYGGIPAIEGLSLSVAAGEIVTVIGPNGDRVPQQFVARGVLHAGSPGGGVGLWSDVGLRPVEGEWRVLP